jgi:alpha-amylase/alpha-mannosidase (GH57 family)
MPAPLIVHGHFYQPPRENPWTEIVYHEASAAPDHDWNERIDRECYRPNAFARIFDERGRVRSIVNNYALISFDFGPTLLRWLEVRDRVTYDRILAADRESLRRLGHGNAIAIGYNHAILPLCNERDRATQVRWGVGDFRRRFGRAPEALWLPETACNDATLGLLIDEGMRFAILSPHQAQRVRAPGEGHWRDVSDGVIDSGRAYVYRHRDGSGRRLALFFYDGALSHAVAFENVLGWSDDLIARIAKSRGDEGRLVTAATDGESYGHHARYGDRVLAYALAVHARPRGFSLTNYGAFLDEHPPQWEVEIKPGPNGEGTAWSCSHGVGRWCRDCGCHGNALDGWNQAWRGPLRGALDFVRDVAGTRFEELGGDLLRDPWAARDDYVDVVFDRGRSRDLFLERHAARRLSSGDQVRALTLLEMQRNALLMYTSCGWFFADISGIETVQVMAYAGRVLDRMDELGLGAPRDRFLEILGEARSNIPGAGTGADVFRRCVDPQRVPPARMVANLALTSLVDEGEHADEGGCFAFQLRDYRKEEYGRLTLATGHVVVEETTTGRLLDCAVAALHLGEIDFYCTARAFADPRRFQESARRLWQRFRGEPLARVLLLMREEFGPDEYGLDQLLPEGRARVSRIVFGELLAHFAQQYEHLYDENRRFVDMLQQAGFRLPRELRVAAELTLGRRFEEAIRQQHGAAQSAAYEDALAIAQHVAARGYEIDRSGASAVFGATIAKTVDAALKDGAERVAVARQLVALIPRLGLDVDLSLPQEAVYEAFRERGPGGGLLVELAEALGLDPAAMAAP